MSLCTVEAAAATLGIAEPWRLRDLAVLGGSPQAFGPFARVEGSAFRVMLDADDVTAWDRAGRPIADSRYREPHPMEVGPVGYGVFVILRAMVLETIRLFASRLAPKTSED